MEKEQFVKKTTGSDVVCEAEKTMNGMYNVKGALDA